jgi:hypothetical protein
MNQCDEGGNGKCDECEVDGARECDPCGQCYDDDSPDCQGCEWEFLQMDDDDMPGVRG